MEAEVYAYGADTVLKLYPGAASLADLMSLRDFYAGLERPRRMPCRASARLRKRQAC